MKPRESVPNIPAKRVLVTCNGDISTHLVYKFLQRLELEEHSDSHTVVELLTFTTDVDTRISYLQVPYYLE